MSTPTESGHATNVQSFNELITACIQMERYKPAPKDLSLEALRQLLTQAQASIKNLNALLPTQDGAIASREAAFEPLSRLATNILNAVKASENVSQQVIDNVANLVAKIQGKRLSAKRTETEKATLLAKGEEVPAEISASQTSYTNRLDNLDKLIQQLTAIPGYAPNENDLKVATLTQLHTTLTALNQAVVEEEKKVDKARDERDKVLYSEKTGMVEIGKSVKTYVKSLGSQSVEYKRISGITFRSYKR